MKPNLRNLLGHKLQTQTTKDFDQKFWMKFNDEFNSTEWSLVHWLKQNSVLFVSTGLTAALAFYIVINTPYIFTPKNKIITAHEIMESQEMLADIEMFSEFEGDVATQDEDWNDLLNEPDNETEEAI